MPWIALSDEEGSSSRGPIADTGFDFNEFNGVGAYYNNTIATVVVGGDIDGGYKVRVRYQTPKRVSFVDFRTLPELVQFLSKVLQTPPLTPEALRALKKCDVQGETTIRGRVDKILAEGFVPERDQLDPKVADHESLLRYIRRAYELQEKFGMLSDASTVGYTMDDKHLILADADYYIEIPLSELEPEHIGPFDKRFDDDSQDELP